MLASCAVLEDPDRSSVASPGEFCELQSPAARKLIEPAPLNGFSGSGDYSWIKRNQLPRDWI